MFDLVHADCDYISFVEFVQIAYSVRGWDFPQLHYDIATWLEDTLGTQQLRLLQAFRYAAKSELTSLYVAWRLYLNPDSTFIIVSAATKLAIRNSDYVKRTIETHPLTSRLVPAKDQWSKAQFNVVRPNPGLHYSVTCSSITSRMTGHHASEILADDVEVDENVRTTDSREMIFGAVQEMLSMSDRLLFIGTPHHEDSIYGHLEYTLGFHTLKRPVWDLRPDPDTGLGGIPAWPELRGAEWIAEKERTLTTGKFRSQFLLIPERVSDSLIDLRAIKIFSDDMVANPFETVDWITGKQPSPVYTIGDERVVDVRSYWDVASGLKGRDNSVVACVAKTEDRNFYILDVEVLPEINAAKGDLFDKQCDAVLSFCKRNLCNGILVETNFALTLANELKLRARERGHRIGIKESIRTNKQNKQEFIAQAIEPLVKTGRLYVHRKVWLDSPFKSELSDFPSSRAHDDTLDAVAGAITGMTAGGVATGDLPQLHPYGVRGSAMPISINAR